MGPVFVAADEFADRAVEAGEIEDRRWCPAVWSEVAGDRGEEFDVDGAEEPFDLPRPCGQPTVEWMILMCRAMAVCSRCC